MYLVSVQVMNCYGQFMVILSYFYTQVNVNTDLGTFFLGAKTVCFFLVNYLIVDSHIQCIEYSCAKLHCTKCAWGKYIEYRPVRQLYYTNVNC